MNKVRHFWPLILIIAVVILFFLPVFRGNIPFPGDLLIDQNPYRTESFLGYAPGGYPNKAQGPDIINEIYPWRYFSVNEIKNGIIPFWNPHNFSGNPQMANFQTAIFYPINILYLVFSFNTAWTLIIMLQPLLAAIFMYLFLNRGLSLKKLPSFIGAISFALSSYMTVWIQYGNIGHTILWLPLVLYFTKRIYQNISIFNFLILVSSLTLSVLAGYVQGVFYIYALCALYFLFLLRFGEIKKDRVKKIIIFSISLFLPITLVAYQLLPTLQLFSSSTRGSYSLSQISDLLAPFKYWVTIFFPDFFGNPATRNYWINGTYIERVMYAGVAITFFAFFALFKAKNLEKKFFAIVGAISLIIATNLLGIKYFYLIPIPVISTTIPTRELSVFIFCLIVLGAMGIDNWTSFKEKLGKFPLIFISIYILSWVAVLFVPGLFGIETANVSVVKRNLILPTVFAFTTLAIFYLRRFKRIIIPVLILLVVFDLFYFFNKITPFAPASFTYPNTSIMSYLKENGGINRFWGYGTGYIAPNFQSVDGSYSPEGNDPLHIGSYGELVASSKYGELPRVIPRPDANIAGGYGKDDLRNNIYRQRILNLLGVKYVLNKNDNLSTEFSYDPAFGSAFYKLIWQKPPWQIYENLKVFPRYFMFNNYVVKYRQEILSLIYDKDFNLENTLLLEEDPKTNIDSNSKGEVELLSYKSNNIEFKTKSNGNNFLFISDNYYPEWSASIDGKETKIYRADYSFRAIAVPKGEHVVKFYYNPKLFLIGLKVFMFGVLVLIAVSLWIKTYEKKK